MIASTRLSDHCFSPLSFPGPSNRGKISNLRRMSMKKALMVVFVCGLLAAFTPSLYAQGDVFAQFFNGAAVGSQLSNGPFTLGWSFQVTNPNGIFVTDLAVFSQGGAALLEDHQVGIWDAAGNLLDAGVV